MTIGSVGTLTCDISSRKYFLAISVLVTATMSFSGFAQLWSGESKVDRLVFVFAEALHCKYFGFFAAGSTPFKMLLSFWKSN